MDTSGPLPFLSLLEVLCRDHSNRNNKENLFICFKQPNSNRWVESYFYKKIVKIFTIQGGNGILAMQQYFHGELQVKIFVTSQAVCHYL